MSSKQKTKEQGHDLNSMSGAFKHLWNRIPLTFKIMLWYTLFLITLLISMSIFYYNYMGTARSTEIRDRLQQQTLIMSTDIRKFKPYEDGTFYLVYTQDGLITKGYLPDGFPNQSNLSLGQVGEIEANGMTFYYYDVPINAPNYRGFLRAITSQKITDKKRRYPIRLIACQFGGVAHIFYRCVNRNIVIVKCHTIGFDFTNLSKR